MITGSHHLFGFGGDSSLAAEVAMTPFDSGFDSPATTPFDSCPIGVSADSCPAGAP